MRLLILVVTTAVVAASCQKKPTIVGLWVVKSVMVGAEEMTPNARWTRFHADHTQESGNGMFQHSYGTWFLDSKEGKLSIENTNGLTDPYEGFKTTIKADHMTWERMEDGVLVQVELERSNQLPQTYGDRVLGLWTLEKAAGKHNLLQATLDPNHYLFLRWDRRFVVGTNEGRAYGVYNVHGHKPEVELIPYNSQFQREFWTVDYNGDSTLVLQLIDSDTLVRRTYKRILEFPSQPN